MKIFYNYVVLLNMYDHYCNQSLRLVLRSDQMPCGAALRVAVLELLGQQERNLNTDWLTCEINKQIWQGLMYDERRKCSTFSSDVSCLHHN